MQSAWTITSVAVALIFTAGTGLMFGPSTGAHWAACAAFLMAAGWMRVMGVMWFLKQRNRDWVTWTMAAGIMAFTLIACPIMIYFAWPVSAQVPPGGVNGNCNVFGNNNLNCNTFNFAPQPLRFTDKVAKEILAKMPAKKKVFINVVGPSTETYLFGSQMATFLKNKGYDAEWTYQGQVMPAPAGGISFEENDKSYIWTVVQ
jgi:hypothetical protein